MNAIQLTQEEIELAKRLERGMCVVREKLAEDRTVVNIDRAQRELDLALEGLDLTTPINDNELSVFGA